MRREKKRTMLMLTPRLVFWDCSTESTSTTQWDFSSCVHFEAVMLGIHMSKKSAGEERYFMCLKHSLGVGFN